MYYDDEVRRFNFLSGLLLGAVLGTGLTLLVRPEKSARKVRSRSPAAKRLERKVSAGWRQVRGRVGREFPGVGTAARRHLKGRRQSRGFRLGG
jgi:gas vesicle protein